jgi:hypothetical protein
MRWSIPDTCMGLLIWCSLWMQNFKKWSNEAISTLVALCAATCWRWFLARGFFYPEDRGDTFLQNVGSHKIYTAPHTDRILEWTVNKIKQQPALGSILLSTLQMSTNFPFYSGQRMQLKSYRSSESKNHEVLHPHGLAPKRKRNFFFIIIDTWSTFL